MRVWNVCWQWPALLSVFLFFLYAKFCGLITCLCYVEPTVSWTIPVIRHEIVVNCISEIFYMLMLKNRVQNVSWTKQFIWTAGLISCLSDWKMYSPVVAADVSVGGGSSRGWICKHIRPQDLQQWGSSTHFSADFTIALRLSITFCQPLGTIETPGQGLLIKRSDLIQLPHHIYLKLGSQDFAAHKWELGFEQQDSQPSSRQVKSEKTWLRKGQEADIECASGPPITYRAGT
jgi:hypothetical protein